MGESDHEQVNNGFDRDRLAKLHVPDISLEQLALFNRDSLQAKDVRSFSPEAALASLRQAGNQIVWTVDIGGTALKARPVKLDHGLVENLEPEPAVVVDCEDGGKGYAQGLIDVRKKAGNLPVGISSAGIFSGIELIDSPNLPTFTQDLIGLGGFEGIFGDRFFASNDAVAMTIAAAIEVEKRVVDPVQRRNIDSGICGGGNGGALSIDGTLVSLEPGHIEIIDKLNPLGVTTLCKWNPYVCLENVGSMGHVEKEWKKLTGEKLTGKQIAQLMYQGDSRATAWLDGVSVINAHSIAGIMQAFNLSPRETTIVLHGGAFKVGGMIERVGATLDKYYQMPVSANLFSAETMGLDNACLSGVAIAAATL